MHERNRRLPFRLAINRLFFELLLFFWQGTAWQEGKSGANYLEKKTRKKVCHFRAIFLSHKLISYRHLWFSFSFCKLFGSFGSSFHQREPWILFTLDEYMMKHFIWIRPSNSSKAAGNFNKSKNFENSHFWGKNRYLYWPIVHCLI